MPGRDFAAEERLQHHLEREGAEQVERTKAVLGEAGRPDLVEDLDRRLRDGASGVTGARSAWHSISDPQRRALILLDGCHGRLVRPAGKATYVVMGDRGQVAAGIRLATVRNLALRGLLEWHGGAFDPEAEAVMTERAAFVLRHGRPAPGTHFEGFRP